MGPATTRRDFLGVLLGGAAAGLSLPSLALAQGPPRIDGTPLADNLMLFAGAGANVVVATRPNGVVMVNGGRADAAASLLKAVAGRTGGARVRALFNTDWRRDRTGSNEVLGAAGVEIIAHEFAKQYLGAEIYVDWEDRTYPPLPARALPNRTFRTSGVLGGGVSGGIEYGHLGQAHTDAAMYVHFLDANVLVAGDALSVGKYPIADYTTGGWLGGLVAANKTLLELAKPDTRIIPGAGPVRTRADLQAHHDMLAALLERFAKLIKQGMGPADIVAAGTTADYDATWGNPDLFVTTAYRGMWLHVRELGGIV